MASQQLRICVRCYNKLSHVKPFYTSWRYFTSRRNTIESKDVRATFLNFFCKQNGHTYVKPSSVIPGKDQGVYFTNAGMNQFKPIFLGTAPSGSEMLNWRRVSNSQKCIRVGGKHNDLADVGADLTHHTFFEMLGSWSFGDYFKVEACRLALELLQQVYRLPADRLYFTYFGGNSALGLEPDLECRDIWRKLGVPENQILPFDMKDNFWDMGDTGPCGPCTEIHYDHIGGRDASDLVNTGSPEVVEIWNLVFMQYDRQKDNELVPLPCCHVDTGMGLERICAVLQGTMSNYNTDLFLPIFKVIQKETGAPPYSDQTGCHDNSGLDTAYRIIADHVRMATVSISDGLLPGRELLEQKLRSVIYRALYQCRHVMKAKEGLVGKLVDPVVDSLGEAFPEIAVNSDKVKQVLSETEERYIQSEREGLRNLKKLLKKNPGIEKLDGENIKQLHTGFYGDSISLEMVELVARLHSLSVEEEAINSLMEENRMFPTAETVFPWLTKDLVKTLSLENLPSTQDNHKYEYETTGDKYVFRQLTGRMICLLDKDNSVIEEVMSGSRIGLILDQTNFYAEKGGQAGDIGTITSQTGTVTVTDTQSCDDYVLHIGEVTEGRVFTGQEVTMVIDTDHRAGCMQNHTCTHVLGSALKSVLGPDVCQQGSAITPLKFTFNFSHVGKISASQLEEVESLVRESIRGKLPVERQLTRLQEAQATPGIVYLDNVVYPSDVYVVSLSNLSTEENTLQSAELCGGTHVFNTADIGEFCITSLTGVGSGTKTVTCLTGEYAREAIENGRALENMNNCLVSDLKAGADVGQCVALQKKIYKMMNDVALPKLVKDKVANGVNSLGTDISTALGKQATAQLKQELQGRMNGSEPYIVHETTSKTVQKITKQMKHFVATKPCILIVSTNRSISALILFPKELMKDRDNVANMFVEASGSHINSSDDQCVLISGSKDNKHTYVEVANSTLAKYVTGRIKTAAS